MDVTTEVVDAPVAAGVAVVAADTGRVLMIQRALIDGEPAGGKWEFPGGKIDVGESTWDAAVREFSEEVGHELPSGHQAATWLSANGIYQLFVYLVGFESDVPMLERSAEARAVVDPDNPSQLNYTEAVAWFDPYDLDRGPRILREECRCMPWSLLKGWGPPEGEEYVVAGAQRLEIEVVPKLAEGAVEDIRRQAAEARRDPYEAFENLVAALSPPDDALLPTHELDGPTPWTVSEDGLTADGHLALWASCHIGYPGCVTPPPEDTFDFYNLTPVVTASGRKVGVGRVTVGTGHAGGDLSWRTAAAHYDNSGHSVAIAHAVKDRWGIRLPSVILASATPEQLEEARLHPLSGDWRRTTERGPLRLVASLAVPVPGYPIPQALVAGGEVQSMFVGFNLEDAAAMQAEADDIAESLGLDPATKIEALRASLLG